MPDLPPIDAQAVSQRLLSRLSDLTYQNIQLELLAETFRDQRDLAVQERNTLSQQVDIMRQVDAPTS